MSNQSKAKSTIELFAASFIAGRVNLLCLKKKLCAKIQHSLVSFFDVSLSAHCSLGEGVEMASNYRNTSCFSTSPSEWWGVQPFWDHPKKLTEVIWCFKSFIALKRGNWKENKLCYTALCPIHSSSETTPSNLIDRDKGQKNPND